MSVKKFLRNTGLALAMINIFALSIKLRERGSPESKPVGKKFDHKTGS